MAARSPLRVRGLDRAFQLHADLGILATLVRALAVSLDA
jgi:hypothetical protein